MAEKNTNYSLVFKKLEYNGVPPKNAPLTVTEFESNFAYLSDVGNQALDEIDLLKASDIQQNQKIANIETALQDLGTDLSNPDLAAEEKLFKETIETNIALDMYYRNSNRVSYYQMALIQKYAKLGQEDIAVGLENLYSNNDYEFNKIDTLVDNSSFSGTYESLMRLINLKGNVITYQQNNIDDNGINICADSDQLDYFTIKRYAVNDNGVTKYCLGTKNGGAGLDSYIGSIWSAFEWTYGWDSLQRFENWDIESNLNNLNWHSDLISLINSISGTGKVGVESLVGKELILKFYNPQQGMMNYFKFKFNSWSVDSPEFSFTMEKVEPISYIAKGYYRSLLERKDVLDIASNLIVDRFAAKNPTVLKNSPTEVVNYLRQVSGETAGQQILEDLFSDIFGQIEFEIILDFDTMEKFTYTVDTFSKYIKLSELQNKLSEIKELETPEGGIDWNIYDWREEIKQKEELIHLREVERDNLVADRNTSISGLNTQIDEQNSIISGLNLNISNIQLDITILSNQMSAAEIDLDAKSLEIQPLVDKLNAGESLTTEEQTSYDSLSSDINNLNTLINDKWTLINEKNGLIDEKNGLISNAQQTISDLQSGIDTYNTEISNINTQTSADITSIRNDIKTINYSIYNYSSTGASLARENKQKTELLKLGIVVPSSVTNYTIDVNGFYTKQKVGGLTASELSLVLDPMNAKSFDGSSIWADLTVKGNDANFQYPPQFNGGGILFDGGNYAVINDNSSLEFTNGAFTTEVWVKFSELFGYQGILSKPGYNDGNGFVLILEANNTICFYAGNGGWQVVLGGQTVPNIDQWYHIVATKTLSGNWKLFVNGQLQGSETQNSSFQFPDNETGMYVGTYTNFPGYNQNPAHHLRGSIGLVKVYKGKSFSQGEINTFYNEGLSRFNGSFTTGKVKSEGVEVDTVLENGLLYDVVNDIYTFDGNDDYSKVSNQSFGTGDLAFSWWENPISQGYTRKFGNINNSGWSTNDWTLGQSGNTITFYVNNYNNGWVVLESLIDTNVWQHFTITRNGDIWSLYINGVLKSSNELSISLDGDENRDFYIGTSGNLWEFSKGQISNLEILHSGLSEIQVLDKYNSTKNKYGVIDLTISSGGMGVDNFVNNLIGTIGKLSGGYNPIDESQVNEEPRGFYKSSINRWGDWYDIFSQNINTSNHYEGDYYMYSNVTGKRILLPQGKGIKVKNSDQYNNYSNFWYTEGMFVIGKATVDKLSILSKQYGYNYGFYDSGLYNIGGQSNPDYGSGYLYNGKEYATFNINSKKYKDSIAYLSGKITTLTGIDSVFSSYIQKYNASLLKYAQLTQILAYEGNITNKPVEFRVLLDYFTGALDALSNTENIPTDFELDDTLELVSDIEVYADALYVNTSQNEIDDIKNAEFNGLNAVDILFKGGYTTHSNWYDESELQFDSNFTHYKMRDYFFSERGLSTPWSGEWRGDDVPYIPLFRGPYLSFNDMFRQASLFIEEQVSNIDNLINKVDGFGGVIDNGVFVPYSYGDGTSFVSYTSWLNWLEKITESYNKVIIGDNTNPDVEGKKIEITTDADMINSYKSDISSYVMDGLDSFMSNLDQIQLIKKNKYDLYVQKQSQVDIFNSQIDNVNNSLQNPDLTQEEIDDLNLQLTSLLELKDSLVVDMTNLSISMEADNDLFESEMDSLLNGTYQLVGGTNSLIYNIKNDISNIDSQISNKNADITSKEVEIQVVEGDILVLYTEIHTKEGERSLASATYSILSGQVTDLNSQISNKTIESDDLTSLISQTETSVQTDQANIIQLNSENVQKNIQKTEQEGQISILESEIPTLESQLTTLNSEKDGLVLLSRFITTWDTTLGDPNSKTIILPLMVGGTYDFVVNWGDGNSESVNQLTQNGLSHTYLNHDVYTVTITGTIQGWCFGIVNTSSVKIKTVEQWGTFRVANSYYASLGYYFGGCNNLQLSQVSDVIDLTGVTSLSNMFSNCISLTTVNNMNDWNVSNITSMSNMFAYSTLFNQNIGSWNVSNVTDMSNMFKECRAFNQNIGSWNVSNVTNMSNMFWFALQFNQPIGSWNVSNVTNMNGMFHAAGFDQDISSWNISKVTIMSDPWSYFMTKTYPYWDNLLISWSQLPVRSNVTLRMYDNKVKSVEASNAKYYLVNTKGWTINDDVINPKINMGTYGDTTGLETRNGAFADGTYFEFDGVNDYIIMYNSTANDYSAAFDLSSGDYMIDFWVKSKSFSGSKAVFYKGDIVTNNGWDYGMTFNRNTIYLKQQTVNIGYDLSENVWYHISIVNVSDTSTSPFTRRNKVYVDGVLIGGNLLFNTTSNFTTQPIKFGSFGGGSEQQGLLNGSIDSFRIRKETVTDADVLNRFNATKTGKGK